MAKIDYDEAFERIAERERIAEVAAKNPRPVKRNLTALNPVEVPGENDEDGELTFTRNGFRCSAIGPENLFWIITTLNGEPIPFEFQGHFTGRQPCIQVIETFVASKKKNK
jgi:hypothetical protein